MSVPMTALLHHKKRKHWYTPSGEPRYGATIRQVRKEGLLPSPTEVLELLHKPELEAWKTENILAAGYDNPPRSGESYGAYALRILKAADEPSRQALRLGNRIHRMAEQYLHGMVFDNDQLPWDIRPIWIEVERWLQENVELGAGEAEKIVTNLAFGYGGKIDYLGPLKDKRLAIVDFKGQRVKTKSGKPTYRKQWSYQLGAYEWACTSRGIFPEVVMNVVISTNTECLGVWEKEWKIEERAEGFEVFTHLLDLFRGLYRIPYTGPIAQAA